MKKRLFMLAMIVIWFTTQSDSCDTKGVDDNHSAFDEQAQTETNQAELFKNQPPPRIHWSLERDNLIKRSLLQNDRAVNFYMYVFIEGVATPIGYYQVTKVSSVNSQLTNTVQMVHPYTGVFETLPSPAEDGSYGENGDGVFGFTPEDIYIETNMHYITATVPLSFAQSVPLLAVVSSDKIQKILDGSKAAMKQK